MGFFKTTKKRRELQKNEERDNPKTKVQSEIEDDLVVDREDQDKAFVEEKNDVSESKNSPSNREREEQRCMRIDDIEIGKTIREVDEKFVDECAESIERIGLLNPITVNESGVLVTGRHRLEAFKKLNRKEIPVTFLLPIRCLNSRKSTKI